MVEVMYEPKIAPMPVTSAEPARRVGPPPSGEQPALLIEHATKRFVVGRRKKSVIAVNDVSMSIRRGEITGSWARTDRARARSSGWSARC